MRKLNLLGKSYINGTFAKIIIMENQNDICSECLSFELYTKYKEAYADKPAMIKLFELDKPWILKENSTILIQQP